MDVKKESLEMHEKFKGKIAVQSKVALKSLEDFSLAYTPGVAEPCREIEKDKSLAFKYTMKANTIAVISNGTAVLGLGNIGAMASIPVMEGKAAIFKELAGVDAFPICIDSEDVDENVNIIKKISCVFGGINLEDYKAPECFEIESRLQDLGIPVMHDDQHGTAIVILAGLINSLKLVGKKKEDVKVVFSGAGSAAIATINLLKSYGFNSENFFVCDSKGLIYSGREGLENNVAKIKVANFTNPEKVSGSLVDVIKGADVFIGLSKKNLLTAEDVKLMNEKSIIFAMANPDPEILPDEAIKGGVFVMATGRSDFPNQVNNALVFPGVFRGALDVRATRITEKMKFAAADALAGMVENLSETNIIPKIFDKNVPINIAKAVGDAWNEER